MFRPLWAPQAIYIRPNKIGCSAMEVHLERVNNATLNRVPISYSWPPTNMSSRRRKYSENIIFAYSSILPPAMPSYSQISHFGGIQAYFHFMSSHLSYAQTFPHSTINNILKKTVLKPCLISSIHIFAHLQTFSLWNFEAQKIVFFTYPFPIIFLFLDLVPIIFLFLDVVPIIFLFLDPLPAEIGQPEASRWKPGTCSSHIRYLQWTNIIK